MGSPHVRFASGIAGRILLVALVAAALVAVLIPVCAMALCGPTGSDGMMGMDFGSILDCEHMYFPSDAPSALIVPVFALLLAFVAVLLFAQERPLVSASAYRFDVVVPGDPDPPGDPFVGRLRV